MTPEQMHFFALEIEKISGLKMPKFKPPAPPKPATLSGAAMSSTPKPVKPIIQPLPKG
jgi:hypothetical protein